MRKNFIIIICTILITGCKATSPLSTIDPIAENNKDVLILSVLVRNYIRETHARTVDLNELLQHDSLNRITVNFAEAVLKYHPGYISLYYTFSATRNTHDFVLTDREKEMLRWNKFSEKKLKGHYDGEMKFDYGERAYHLKKIIVKKRE
jgi:hypothetical protein